MLVILGAIPTALSIATVAIGVLTEMAETYSEARWGKEESRRAAGMAMSGLRQQKFEEVEVYAFDNQKLLLTPVEARHLATLRSSSDWKSEETVDFLAGIWEAQEDRI